MTTRLSRPVRRAVVGAKGEPYVVTLSARGVEIRLPRRRYAYLVPYGNLMLYGARLFADAQPKKRRTKRRRT